MVTHSEYDIDRMQKLNVVRGTLNTSFCSGRQGNCCDFILDQMRQTSLTNYIILRDETLSSCEITLRKQQFRRLNVCTVCHVWTRVQQPFGLA